uniref:Ras protein specific guanine nucleotide releasing factor 1 n=1 Tax=Eptatretus burgeri TaxID=7764 RepID=A0A8C4N3Q6_EPTBU
MQRTLRYNDLHVAALACRARRAGTRVRPVRKHSADGSRWHGRWLALYQNLLFCFESESSVRPLAVYLVEGCACRRVGSPRLAAREPSGKHVYFTVNFDSDGQKVLEFQAENEADCEAWVSAISQCSYADLQEDREALLHKLNHVLHIVDAEKAANDQLRQQLEDSETEVARLKAEIAALNKTNKRMQQQPTSCVQDEDPDIRKIKKVQSFMRGWLCRRKWKTIVQDYIHSPHAENMRKRNRIVFSMVEAEAEYTQQLHTLVAVFLRPLRMAASSKKPPISHDDVSSIFLNSETIMFLHQIFYQGLRARIANWPTLILADLFDILLPMLNIYQEFLRNHQYSLQVLASCKQNRDFDKLLKQYEAKSDCENRTLETFLTLPMFQIPRYIVTLHELLAHTPHEHVERKSLEFAKQQLEELSRVLHDEVSETENIRKSLAVERMIVEGCDVLLDSSQMFVRQGSLYQLPVAERGWASRSRMASLSLRREGERQCFLFTKHLLICTRSSGGKLHLIKMGGVLPLIQCTLIEDTDICEDEGKVTLLEIEHLDFKLVVESRDAPPYTVILMATSLQEKAAWASDISQCIDNIRCDELMMNVFEESSKVTVPQMVKYVKPIHNNPENTKDPEDLNDPEDPKHDPEDSKHPQNSKYQRTQNTKKTQKIQWNYLLLHNVKFETLWLCHGHVGFALLQYADHQVHDKEFVIRRAATNRVLNVLRHWVFKHSQDFERNQQLKISVISFLEEVLKDPEILGQERKAVNNILSIRGLVALHWDNAISFLLFLLQCSNTSPASLETLPSLELAEQLTLLDCLVFGSIPYEEFLGQSWMKPNKNDKTPCILKATKHFNEVSNLVVWEIVRQPDLVQRTAIIEKWVAVADICRCLHNYNGILEIASAINRSAVFRLKKTWARVSKQTKGMIEKLQKIVSSEGRFKNLRETLKSCDAPCVPYLGMYLTDLALIEEGTSNFTPEGLVNFSKMRMVRKTRCVLKVSLLTLRCGTSVDAREFLNFIRAWARSYRF